MRHQKRRRLVKLRESEHYGALLRARALDRLGKAAALVLLDRVQGRKRAQLKLRCLTSSRFSDAEFVNETNDLVQRTADHSRFSARPRPEDGGRSRPRHTEGNESKAQDTAPTASEKGAGEVRDRGFAR